MGEMDLLLLLLMLPLAASSSSSSSLFIPGRGCGTAKQIRTVESLAAAAKENATSAGCLMIKVRRGLFVFFY